MRVRTIRLLTCALAVTLLPLGACMGGSNKTSEMPDMPPSMKEQGGQAQQPLSSSTAVVGKYGPRAMYNGKNVSSIEGSLDSGLVLPDGAGGVVVVPGAKREQQSRNYVDARELKLKVRELAEQLVADMRDCSLQGTVALPVSFVNLNDFTQTSPFGRLMSEQLFYEFNQRGFPIREYRIPGSITMREGEGEFYLSRELGQMAVHSPGSVVIAGTYYSDKQAIIVNARLIRPSDGRVLRTANLVLAANPFTRRMLAGTGKKLEGSAMHTRDFKEATVPAVGGSSPFDRGEDIH